MMLRKDPLSVLEVIDKLEVSSIQLEPRRVRATYKLTRGKKTESMNLIYRFHEPVFDPKEKDSWNLACMVVAQVALNYGQFCSAIVFHGDYDATDRAFIAEVMESTAREIFVKKILQHNPFIKEEAAHLPPLKIKKYVRARVMFHSLAKAKKLQHKSAHPWPVDPKKFSVLSSGGKESLLSFSLLRELKNEVHPIFVNESGRHWFTALNSYRHFEKKIPHTARLWTNVDRVMCWIERRLRFVRPNFHDSPSDEYPIRLWTLPLFLFGVLPLARRRGIGRIVIGDEYDTSRRFNHRGIPHYDGLYDQSRYFDNFMSRYYQRKGWGFTQFSVVRPLSEMLVQKVLVSRYPEIQQYQISCHAAHIEGHKVKPCGNCEKCRRIVGMMMAFGADPRRCGYTPAQIKDVLRALPGQNFRQESAGAQQMAYLLAQKGLFPLKGPGSQGAKRHPEILQLRFDQEHAPMDAIPVFLRQPILRICHQYSEGAILLRGGKWQKINPLRHPGLRLPYAFD